MNGPDIKSLRKRLGLTQTEFGYLLDAHSVTVSRWESGHMEPNAFQVALMHEFKNAADKQAQEEFGQALKNILVGAGIAAALYWLLKLSRE